MATTVSRVSFVIPVFRSSGSLAALCTRVANQMESLALEWEVLFIVDGEGDVPWRSYLEELSEQPHARAVLLGRNVGQHAAIRFGLGEVAGSIAYIMDCDLQDPPEIIPEVLAPIVSGDAEVVLTRRGGHRSETSSRFLRKAYNNLAHVVTGLSIPYEVGPVMALSPRAVSYVRMFREEAHTLQILAWLGLPSATVVYERQERPSGRSSYSLAARLRHAASGLSFSTARVLAMVFVGSLLLAVGSIVFLGALLVSLLSGSPPSGWLSLITVSVLGFALLSMLVSFTGALVIQVLNLARQRPTVTVARTSRNK